MFRLSCNQHSHAADSNTPSATDNQIESSWVAQDTMREAVGAGCDKEFALQAEGKLDQQHPHVVVSRHRTTSSLSFYTTDVEILSEMSDL